MGKSEERRREKKKISSGWPKELGKKKRRKKEVGRVILVGLPWCTASAWMGKSEERKEKKRRPKFWVAPRGLGLGRELEKEKEKEKKKRSGSCYIGRATVCRLFTSAIPLLFHAAGFACYVSILGQFPALQRPGHHWVTSVAHIHTELSADA